MDLIADTSFLVGLWRKQNWAMTFASSQIHISLGLPWVVLGEFWCGATRAGHESRVVGEFLALGRPLLEVDKVIPAYAKMCARLQDQPTWKQIGQNDLWIAASCLAWDKPLLTRNIRHFDKIDGLQLKVLVNEK